MKKKRVLALLLASTMVASTFLNGCGSSTTEDTQEDTASLLRVSVTSPITSDINVSGEYVGTFSYDNEISVFPLLSGEITNTYYEEGDYVEAGTVLFTLDDEAYQLSYDNAVATYNTAQINIDSQINQLQMGRDQAVNQLATAQEGVSQIMDTIDQYNEQIKDLESQRIDMIMDRTELSDDKDDMKKDLEEAEDNLEKAMNAYKDAMVAYQSAEAAKIQQDMIIANGGTVTDMIITDSYLSGLKQGVEGAAQAVSAAQQAVATYKSAVQSMRSGIESYDSGIEQLENSVEGVEFQIDNMNYSYQQAMRGAQLAQENLDYFDNYTIPSAHASADATLAQAQIGINSAQLQLDHTVITAPVSGTITRKSVQTHDMAQAGYPAYVLVDKDSMIVSFGVPESVARSLMVGQSVNISKDNVDHAGKIVEVGASVDQATGLFIIKASIDNADDSIISGTKATVTATVNSAKGVTSIPVDCVYYESGQAYVYAAKDGVVSKVYVETGLYNDEMIQILTGVSADMEIITSWSSELRDGLEVEVVYE